MTKRIVGLATIGCAALGLAFIAADAQPSHMAFIDPIGGAWRVLRIGDTAVPDKAEVRVFFTRGSDYGTQAGCGNFGGFYSLQGSQIRTRPRDDIVTSKCRSAAAAQLTRTLAGIMGQASRYTLLPDGALRLTTRDGRTAILRRPAPAIAALVGQWNVERIGRDIMPPSRRARMNFRDDWLTAVADCNQLSARIIPNRTGFTFGDGGATEMGCGPEREAFDERFFKAVGDARRFVKLADGGVRLEGGETLVLRRPAPRFPRLPGTYRACRSNPGLVGYDDEPVLTFTATRIRDNAGCEANYRADGARLDIRRDTSKACAIPPASLDPYASFAIGNRVSPLAALRPDAYAFDDEGVLTLRSAHGLFGLCRDGEPRPFGS